MIEDIKIHLVFDAFGPMAAFTTRAAAETHADTLKHAEVASLDIY